MEKEEAETKRRKEEAEREEEARKKALAEKADKVLFEFQACVTVRNFWQFVIKFINFQPSFT